MIQKLLLIFYCIILWSIDTITNTLSLCQIQISILTMVPHLLWYWSGHFGCFSSVAVKTTLFQYTRTKKDLHNGPFWDTKVMLFYCFDVTFSFQKIGVIGLCRLLTLSDPFFWYKARSYDRSVSPILEPSLLVIRIGHKNIASRWISWSRWVEVEIYFENIARLLCFSFIITNCMADLQKTTLF